MVAFNGSLELAARIRERVQHHFDADEIIHGQYWEDGKGCAVGCILHNGNHHEFEKLGIPVEIAYLLDGLFEALPNGEAKDLPRRFVNAIKPGADLSMIIPQFLFWMLAEDEEATIKAEMHETTKAFVQSVIAGFEQWLKTGERPAEDSAVSRAARAAREARDAWAARAAREAWAAWAARAARAAREAREAWDARAAREAWAAWAAREAWDARDARAAWAAWAAWAAREAWDARDASRKARNKRAAGKLIELLKAA